MNDLLSFDLHLFDLDDTLLNTSFAYTSAQKTALQKAFPDLSETKQASYFNQLNWISHKFGSGNVADYMGAFLLNLNKRSFDLDKALSLMLSVYDETYWSLLECIEGASGYLQVVTDKGKSIALISNGNVETQRRKVGHAKLEKYFPFQVCYISGQYRFEQKKPSPFMIKLACERAGILPEHSVFYGNSIEDVLAGNLAGVTTAFCGIVSDLSENNPEIAYPDYVFQDWDGEFQPIDK